MKIIIYIFSKSIFHSNKFTDNTIQRIVKNFIFINLNESNWNNKILEYVIELMKPKIYEIYD